MSLTITEEHKSGATSWNVLDDGILIATFDSRGGYTRADAEAVIADDKMMTFDGGTEQRRVNEEETGRN